ncbi:MAG: hypothetical protein HQL91_09120 [Magnetococcales bacterium]|nr:hypothetical protein [Magnetococcales bacterium]
MNPESACKNSAHSSQARFPWLATLLSIDNPEKRRLAENHSSLNWEIAPLYFIDFWDARPCFQKKTPQFRINGRSLHDQSYVLVGVFDKIFTMPKLAPRLQ